MTPSKAGLGVLFAEIGPIGRTGKVPRSLGVDLSNGLLGRLTLVCWHMEDLPPC